MKIKIEKINMKDLKRFLPPSYILSPEVEEEVKKYLKEKELNLAVQK